jgi:hypothetical protein
MGIQGHRGHTAQVGLLVLGLLAGCYPWKCSEEAVMPSPNGTFTHQLFDAQAAKAEADDFVIYKNEWYMEGKTLGPYGTYHLAEITKRLPEVPFPVVIQPSADPDLNEVRRQAIVTCLLNHGCADADHRVIIAYPQAEGWFAECEAERTFIRMLLPQYNPYFSNGFGSYFGSGRFGAGGFYGGFGGGGFFGGY